MIFCHLATILSLLSQALAATRRTIMADATQVCLNVENGVAMPNPYDCETYFSCVRVPHLRFCDNGQHFDATSKVCTTPEQANCTQEDISGITSDFMKAEAYADADATSDIDFWFHRPRPIFMAVDVLTGQPIDPLDKYDPENIECRHLGAYFLPHPHNCQRYYICAYGHLHQHRCGRGTFWSYKHTECQMAEYATCYANTSTQQYGEDTKDDTVKQTSVSPTTAALPIANINETFAKPITVCYVIDAAEINNKHNNTVVTPVAEANTTVPVPISPALAPSPPRPVKPTTTTTTTLAPVVTSTARAQTIKCPSERQSYLADPEDCSKYFICIGGVPVLTACPTGLYWDQQLGFCDIEQNVKCYQIKKKKQDV